MVDNNDVIERTPTDPEIEVALEDVPEPAEVPDHPQFVHRGGPTAAELEPDPEPPAEPKPKGGSSQSLPHQGPGITARQFVLARKFNVRRAAGFLYYARKNHANERHLVPDWMVLWDKFWARPVR